MASKQVNYEIRAGVKGRESITGLADDLEDVAKVLGGELSQQAKEAANKLRDLAKQDEAITAFNRLESEARDAGRALKAAEVEAGNYAKQIAAAGPPTAQEATNLQRLRTAADSARATLDQQKQALAGAQAELQRYGIAGQNAQAAQQRLRQEVAQVRDSVKALAPAYGDAASGAQNAGASMNRTHRQIGDGVDSISGQLRRLQGIYAAFQGLQGTKAVLSDLADTADAYNNLQGRIKLATGEGKNFTGAFTEVSDIAERTSSNLELTGNLFGKLTETGKSAGQSTQQAISQALGLTETINEAIQLSGGSADSAKAAVGQLIQGLQGGVLRGDEFNSVMEQSPRLAKALADGLGVTTGELRKMAEAGELGADKVVGALKSQSDTLKREFSTLPPTVGRALENLSTRWTIYVGEADKATGASSVAAGAIGALARNLDTVAGFLIDAGQAAAAFAALKLAQHFLGIGAAATQSAAGVAAHTAAVNAAGAASTTAAANVGRFASILGGLKTLTVLGIVTNFKDIGTSIGETIAKMAGYKDRSEEIARADKISSDIAKQSAADRQRLADLTQAAIDKQFELSKAAGLAVSSFEKLTKEGTSAAEAIDKVGKDFDLSKLDGIRDFSAVLDKLGANGKLVANEIKAAWAEALNGKDLAQFEVTARAAFSGSAREAERVAQMLDATVREAVRRTGLEFELLQGRVGAASRSAINDVEAIVGGLDRLKAQGVDTGLALTASLNKAISTADSQQAIDLLRARIEQLRSTLGDKITDGLLDQAVQKSRELKDSLDRLLPGIQGVEEAFRRFGLRTKEEMASTAASSREAYDVLRNSGQATADQLREAFVRTANEAIAANKGIAPEWVRVEAAIRGVNVQAGEYGVTADRVAEQSTGATDRVADGWRRAGDAAKQAGIDGQVSMEQLVTAAKKVQEINARYAAPGGSGNKTSDGLAKNADGSAAGTFNNNLPVDVAFNVADRVRRGEQFGAADIDLVNAAYTQAKNAYDDMQAFMKLNPGAASFEYQQSTTALFNATRTALEQATAVPLNGAPGSGATSAPSGPSNGAQPIRTVNFNLSINGTARGTVPTDEAGAATLQVLMDELQRAKAAAGS